MRTLIIWADGAFEMAYVLLYGIRPDRRRVFPGVQGAGLVHANRRSLTSRL
jgi:hypothetical protein